ncbi:Formyltransferase [Cytidiella melzeri]|nr:Formyltransferase [Cytidiella melzeri]
MLRSYFCHQAASSSRSCSAACRRYTQSAGKYLNPFEVLYFGRDEFSRTVLEELYAAKDVWQDISIVTQPDMKVGRRGSQVSRSPLKQLGERLQLPVHTIPTERSAFRYWQVPLPSPFSESPPSPSRVLVTASFGRILPNSLLQRFAPGRRLNVHPSLLPEYRGPAPIQHALLDGMKETGVCVIEMMEFKKGIDAGDIWGQRQLPIPEDVVFPVLRDSLALEGGKLLVSVLREMRSGTATSTPQRTDASARHAPLITTKDALLDFRNMTASAIVQRHNAVSHQKGVFTRLKTGKILQLHDPVVLESPPVTLLSLIPDVGLAIYEPHGKALLIRCAFDTVLSVRMVQQQDKKALNVKAWWNGVRPEMRHDSSMEDGPIVFL